MSFFNDFLQSVSIEDCKNKIFCDLIFGSAVKISADFKIEDLSENQVVLKCKKNKLKILGSELKIVSLSKGEIEIVGNVNGVVKL